LEKKIKIVANITHTLRIEHYILKPWNLLKFNKISRKSLLLAGIVNEIDAWASFIISAIFIRLIYVKYTLQVLFCFCFSLEAVQAVSVVLGISM